MIFSVDPEKNLWHCIEKLCLHYFKHQFFCKKILAEECGVIVPDSFYPDDNLDLLEYINNSESKFVNLMMGSNIHIKAKVIESIYSHPTIQDSVNDSTTYGCYEVKRWYLEFMNCIKFEKHYVVGEDKQIGVKIFTSDKFIAVKFSNFFLQHICDEINNCYANQFFIATIILSRKLCERLLAHILKAVLKENSELWWDLKNARFKKLEDLLCSLKESVEKFDAPHIYMVKDIYTDLKNFKNYANKVAHVENKVPNIKTFDDYDIRKIVLNLNILHAIYCKDECPKN